ncbi:MAG: SelB C-terminal domain-containing protein, partial [bacterium]
EYFQKILGTVISRITDSDGLTGEEIARIDKAGYNEFTDFIINNLQENEIALHMGKYMHRSTFENQSKTGSLAEEAAYNIIHGGKFSPPLRVDLEKELQYSENEIRDALNSLVKQERIIRINYNLLISSENIDEIIARVIDWEVGSKEFTVSEFRQRLDISRKYAVPICEYLDREGITERRGDVRVIVAEWEE